MHNNCEVACTVACSGYISARKSSSITETQLCVLLSMPWPKTASTVPGYGLGVCARKEFNRQISCRISDLDGDSS